MDALPANGARSYVLALCAATLGCGGAGAGTAGAGGLAQPDGQTSAEAVVLATCVLSDGAAYTVPCDATPFVPAATGDAPPTESLSDGGPAVEFLAAVGDCQGHPSTVAHCGPPVDGASLSQSDSDYLAMQCHVQTPPVPVACPHGAHCEVQLPNREVLLGTCL